MEDHSLSAISPVDGRYHKQTSSLASWFSEEALIRYRIRIEAAYFTALCEIPLPQLKDVPAGDLGRLDRLWSDFSPADALRVKEIETVTNHDVKAVEYFIREKLKGTPLEPYLEFIHFGLTSQDVNNTAMPLALKEAMEALIIPELKKVTDQILKLSEEWKDIPMLAHTHGQPASPTHLGKELFVFADRLMPLVESLASFRHSGKFGGATGNLNAHKAAYPGTDWVKFSNDFLEIKLGLTRQKVTTQIDHYDDWAALFHIMTRINTILIDLNRDIWSYISMNYFKQKVKEGEVGSSTMPHKVNPIDFENSEGNLAMANALFGFLAGKLPVSRLQRDLTDSTVTRNIGVPFAHSLIAWKSLFRGLEKLILNNEKIRQDLDENWVVVAEAIQTVLRREGVPNPFELLKGLTRGNQPLTKDALHAFINSLDIPDVIKTELKTFAPSNYTGYTHKELVKK